MAPTKAIPRVLRRAHDEFNTEAPWRYPFYRPKLCEPYGITPWSSDASGTIDQADSWRKGAARNIKERSIDLAASQASLAAVNADKVAAGKTVAKAEANSATMAAVEQAAAEHTQRAMKECQEAAKDAMDADTDLGEATNRSNESFVKFDTAQQKLAQAEATLASSQAMLQEATKMEKRHIEVARLAEQEAQAAVRPLHIENNFCSEAEKAKAEAEKAKKDADELEKTKQQDFNQAKQKAEGAMDDEWEARRTAVDANDEEHKAAAARHLADDDKKHAGKAKNVCSGKSTAADALAQFAQTAANAEAAALDPSGIPFAILAEAKKLLVEAASGEAEGTKGAAEQSSREKEQGAKQARHKREGAVRDHEEKRKASVRAQTEERCNAQDLSVAKNAALMAGFEAEGAKKAHERAKEKVEHAHALLDMKQKVAAEHKTRQEEASKTVQKANDAVKMATTELAEARKLFEKRQSELQMARRDLDNQTVVANTCRRILVRQSDKFQTKWSEEICASDTRAQADAVAEKCRMNCEGVAREQELAKAIVNRSNQVLVEVRKAASVVVKHAQEVEQCARAADTLARDVVNGLGYPPDPVMARSSSAPAFEIAYNGWVMPTVARSPSAPALPPSYRPGSFIREPEAERSPEKV